jgi:hypothetical protein
LLRASLDDADFSDNYFEQLTAATLILADSGAIRIEDNQALECYAGFWLLALATLVANANTFNLRGAGTGDQADIAAVAGALALISWDTIMRGLLLGAISYPLPDNFDLVRAGVLTTSNAPVAAEKASFINNAVEVIRGHFATVEASDTSNVSAATGTADNINAAGSSGFIRINEVQAEMFQVAGFPPPRSSINSLCRSIFHITRCRPSSAIFRGARPF